MSRELVLLVAAVALVWVVPPSTSPVASPPDPPPPEPPPDLGPDLGPGADPPPCDFNSMCSCAVGEVSCIGVPLHSMPGM